MIFNSIKDAGQWHQRLLSHLHLVFLIIFGPITIAFCFLTPPLQPNDEWAHFERAVELSYGEPFGVKPTGSNCGGFYLPAGVFQFVRSPDIQPAFYMGDPVTNLDPLKKDLLLLEWGKRDTFDICPFAVYPPTSYLAPALGLALSRWADFPILISFYIGRLFSAIFGLLLSALAIKWIDTGKLFAFVILCTPEARFLAGSLSHDSSVTAYAALAVGMLCLWLRKRETSPSFQPFQGRELGLLISAGVLIAFVVAGRPPNFPLVFLAALCIWFWTRDKQQGVQISLGFAGLVLLYPAIWILLVHNLGPQNEFGSDNVGQVHFILRHFDLLPGIFFHTVLSNSQNYLITFVGIMGSGAQSLPSWCNGFYLAVLFLCLLHEELFSARRFPFSLIGIGALLLLSIFLILNLYAYIFWTPLGHPLINGVGGRYFFPLLLFTCLFLGLRRVPWKAGWLALTLSVICLASLTVMNITALLTVTLDYYYIR